MFIERDWVWMDLEMTGLNPSKDKILEIAILVTDSNLNITVEGPNLVINHTKKTLESMDDWNTSHHTKSGLIEESKKSKIKLKDAEKIILDFLQKNKINHHSVLCGSSIHIDKEFLKSNMPTLHDYFHFRIIDVSSVIELSKKWYPNLKPFRYNSYHRAMDDIKESVNALKYYRSNAFR